MESVSSPSGETKASIDKASFRGRSVPFLFCPAHTISRLCTEQYVDDSVSSHYDDVRTRNNDGKSDVTFKATYNDKLEAAALKQLRGAR